MKSVWNSFDNNSNTDVTSPIVAVIFKDVSSTLAETTERG